MLPLRHSCPHGTHSGCRGLAPALKPHSLTPDSPLHPLLPHGAETHAGRASQQVRVDPLTRRLQRGPRQYVIFTDSDEDDTMAITALAVQQALYGDVNITAIVVEDGFLAIDQGLQWISYWMDTFFPQLGIPIVRGYRRSPYLNATRVFPASWVSEYTGLLSTYYPAWTSYTPAPESPEQLAAALLAVPKRQGRFSVLSIGPTTSLPILFDLYPALLERAEYAAFDLGSVAPHPIYPGARKGWGGGARPPAVGARPRSVRPSFRRNTSPRPRLCASPCPAPRPLATEQGSPRPTPYSTQPGTRS